jgi:uncharacterized damage-inducible protein DinB
MDALRMIFHHHEWATLTLIDLCAGLPPDVQSATVPGTHGSIKATLIHLVAADQRYLRRMLDGQAADREVREDGGLRLAELREPFEQQARGWQQVLDRLGTLNVTLPAEPEEGWPEIPHAENLLLLQAIHHGNDHRTQVCTILGAFGRDVPDLAGWGYWEATRLRPRN